MDAERCLKKDNHSKWMDNTWKAGCQRWWPGKECCRRELAGESSLLEEARGKMWAVPHAAFIYQLWTVV